MIRAVVAGLVVLWLAACSTPDILGKRAALEPAANSGDAAAQYQLGLSYCCGFGAGHDTAKAARWFCEAALQDYGPAQYQLGRVYGVRSDTHWQPRFRQDIIYAYMWYSLAALKDVPLAAAERDALARDMSEVELREAKEHLRNWREAGC